MALAAVILIFGACVVLLLSRRKVGNGNRPRWRLPLAAVVAGPVISFGLWAADVFMLNTDMYPAAFQGDAMAALLRVMIIGTSVGVIVAVGFAIGLVARLRSED